MSEKYKHQIYHTITLIPEGCVASYGQIADLAGLPGRARLVGFCLKQHDTPTNLPWQRVVRSNGEIAFPKGSEMATQQCELLLGENVFLKNNRVNMKKYQWMPDMTDLLFNLKF